MFNKTNEIKSLAINKKFDAALWRILALRDGAYERLSDDDEERARCFTRRPVSEETFVETLDSVLGDIEKAFAGGDILGAAKLSNEAIMLITSAGRHHRRKMFHDEQVRRFVEDTSESDVFAALVKTSAACLMYAMEDRGRDFLGTFNELVAARERVLESYKNQ